LNALGSWKALPNSCKNNRPTIGTGKICQRFANFREYRLLLIHACIGNSLFKMKQIGSETGGQNVTGRGMSIRSAILF